jgi:DNA repair protein RAD50
VCPTREGTRLIVGCAVYFPSAFLLCGSYSGLVLHRNFSCFIPLIVTPMSYLEKLAITGIRSFSPETASTIEFYKPLTFIVGPNGCGKTTTIECLRYATTGELPPGSDSGKNFVHDPTLANVDNVTGCVKLKFMNTTGQARKITRVMKLTKKGKTLKFQTLDSTLELKDDAGRTTSQNHKVKDTNNMIPEMLSCSKAVLDNVIFTHQEDSNWPLGDNKELKDRFDKIFESTRYTKALDDIQKQKKANKAKSEEAREQAALIHKDLAQYYDLKTKLEKAEMRIQATDQEHELDNKKLVELSAEVKEIQKRIDKASAIEADVSVFRARLEMKQKEAQNVYELIETPFHETLPALKLIESQLNDANADDAEKIELLKSQKQHVDAEREKLQKDVTKRDVAIGMACEKQQECLKHLSSHFQSAKALSRRYNIVDKPGAESEFHASQSASFLAHLKRALASKQGVLDQCEDMLQIVQREKQQYQTEMEVHKKTCSSEANIAKERIDALNAQISSERQIMARASNETTNARALATIEKKIVKSSQKLEAIDSEREEDKVKEIISGQEKEKDQLRLVISSLRDECEEYERRSTAMASVRRQKEKLDAESSTLQTLTEELEKDLRKICDDNDEDLSYLAELVKDIVERKAGAIKRGAESLVDMKADCRTRENELDNLLKKNQMNRTRCNSERCTFDTKLLPFIREHVDKSVTHLSVEDAVTALTVLRKKAKEARKNVVSTEAMAKIYQIAEQHAGEHEECMLCTRAFHGTELNAFFQRLKICSSIDEDTSGEAAVLEEQSEQLQEIVRSYKMYKAQSDQLEEEESLFAEKELSVQKLKKSVADAAARHAESEKDLEKMKKVLDLSVKFLKQEDIVKRFQEQYEEEKFSVNGAADVEDAQMTLDTLRDDLRKNRDLEDVLEDKISRNRKRLEKVQLENRSVEKAHKALVEERLLLEKQMESTKKSKETIQRLMNEKKSIEKNQLARKAEQKSKSLEIDTRIAKQNEKCMEAAAKLQPVKDDHDECSAEVVKFEMSHQTLERHEKLNLSVQILNDESELELLKNRISSLETKSSELTSEINHTTNNSNAAKIKNLRENIRYKEIEEDIKNLKKTLEVKLLELEELDPDSANVRFDDLDQELGSVQRKIEKDRGKRNELMHRKEELVRDLSEGKFQNVENRHSEKVIEYQTLLMTVNDLDKYYKALDSALHQYHSTKIGEINSIIRELWQLTYRGSDIDTIEIRSDANEAATKSRGRNYNYRVVMKKGKTNGTRAINMRGHCSAGQKVLASLIVRLALAETFSGGCGVFCLDEPTTNLDGPNKRGFAEALQQILEVRSKQTNFQLIVITHDEEFMNYLSSQQSLGGGMPQSFFRISREESKSNPGNYYSKAARHTF